MNRVLLATILFCLSGLSASAAEHIVDQKKLKFNPDKLSIAVGDTVIFKNSDRTAHQVTTKSGMKVNSPLLPPKKEFKIDFPAAGTFDIGCHIHPRMKLVITVKE